MVEDIDLVAVLDQVEAFDHTFGNLVAVEIAAAVVAEVHLVRLVVDIALRKDMFYNITKLLEANLP